MPLVADIGEVLNSEEPPKSIEILPGSADLWLPPDIQTQRGFLLEDNHLGIPQKTCYKAYLQAVSIFTSCPSSRCLLQSEPTVDLSIIRDIMHSSAVILLANPAHQTALNARKRLVLSGSVEPLVELRLSAALLTLRDCSKQTIMWHHRRWLLRRLYSIKRAADTVTSPGVTEDEDTLFDSDIPVPALAQELAIAARAAETYSRNYFAWNHRGRVVDALLVIVRKTLADNSPDGDLDHLEATLEDEHAWVMKWVDLHVSDYTAVQYLRHVDTSLRTMAAEMARDGLSPSQRFADLEVQILHHAHSLLRAYPHYESVWMYARIVQGLEMSESDGLAYASEVVHVGSHASSLPEYQEKTKLYARRFLAWHAHDQKRPMSRAIRPRDVLLDNETARTAVETLLQDDQDAR